MKVNEFLTSLGDAASEHMPDILIGVGITGFIISIGLGIKATQKSDKMIAEKEIEKNRPLTKEEKFKTTWKNYIPTVISAAAGTTAIVCASKEYNKRNAAIAALCTIAETTLADYKEVVQAEIGEEKHNDILDKVEERKIQRIEHLDVHQKRDGYSDVREFYDLFAGRIITTSMNDIHRTVNELNRILSTGDSGVSLNDFYMELGVDTVSFGDDVGWNLLRDTDMIEVFVGREEDCINKNGIVYPTFDFRTQPTRRF